MFAVKYRSAFAAESAAQKSTYDPEPHDKCLAAWAKGAAAAKPASADAAMLRKKHLAAFERASRFVVLTDEQVAAVTATCFEALPGETAHAVARARPGLDASVRLALTAVHHAAFAAGFASAGSDTSQAPTVPLSAEVDAVSGDYAALLARACGDGAAATTPLNAAPAATTADTTTRLPSVSTAVAEALMLTPAICAALAAAECAAAGVPSLLHGVLSRRCELLVEASDAALDAELLAEREDDDDDGEDNGATGRQQVSIVVDPKLHVSRAVERCVREAFKSLVRCPSHNAPAGNAEYAAWEPTGVPRYDRLSREAAAVGLDLRRLELAKAVAAAEGPLLAPAAAASAVTTKGDQLAPTGAVISSPEGLDAHAASVHKLVDYELGGGTAGVARASAALTRAVSVVAPLTAPADASVAAAAVVEVVSNLAARLGQVALRSAVAAVEAATVVPNSVETHVCFAIAAVSRIDSTLRGEAWWRTVEHCAWALAVTASEWATSVASALLKTWLSPELISRVFGGTPASAALTSARLPGALVPFAVLAAVEARRPTAAAADLHMAFNATVDEAVLASQADGVAVDSALVSDLACVARVLEPRPPATSKPSATSASALVRTAGATFLSATNPRGAIACAKRAVPKRFDGDADATVPLAPALVTVATLASGVRRAAVSWLAELARDVVDHTEGESDGGAPAPAWGALLDARRAAAKTSAKLQSFEAVLVGALAGGVAPTPATAAAPVEDTTGRSVGAKAPREPGAAPSQQPTTAVVTTKGPRPERSAETTAFVRGLPPTSNRAAVAAAVEAALGLGADDFSITFRSGATPTAYVNFAEAEHARRALEGDALAAALGGGKVKVAPYRG